MLALNLFDWTVPDSVNPEYLEKQLYHRGGALFFESENYGYMALGFTSGRISPYGEPVEFYPISNNGVQLGKRNASNAVLIKNNTLRKPTAITIHRYALDLYEIKRTIDTNMKNQKMPGLWTCDESVRHTLEHVLEKVDGNKAQILGDKSLRDEVRVSYINSQSPYIIDKLREEWHETVNELLTFLGVDNPNRNKKERLITDEVQSNNEYTDLSASVMLQTRQRACDAINKMFPDANMSVKFNQYVKNPQKQVDDLLSDIPNAVRN